MDALQSMLIQSAKPELFELVIVNNNSTDKTEQLCRNFINENQQLNSIYVIEKNQGLSHARNRGIKESNGKYIAFIDDDAIAEERFVDETLKFQGVTVLKLGF